MWQQRQLKKIFGEVLWVSHFPILMAPTQAQESILSFILILKWWLIDKCLQSKSYNPSQDVYNFKGLKMRVTGFRTKIIIPGTGICLVARAADIPGNDPSSVEKSQL